MTLIIKHRFIDRLLPEGQTPKIRILILGTFNPAIPEKHLMSPRQSEKWGKFYESLRSRTFNEVLNYYDRPPNRFWGVLDRAANPDTFAGKPRTYRNKNTLKHYKGFERLEVFRRQTLFCEERGIFISDLIRSIQSEDFEKIYKGFTDSFIDKCVFEPNVDQLVALIKKHKPAKVVLNLMEANNIPTLSGYLRKVKAAAGGAAITLPSTSGAAGGSYPFLVDRWGSALELRRYG